MKVIKGQVPAAAHISIAFSCIVNAICCIGIGLLLTLGGVFLPGCGNGDAGTSESKKYISHEAIELNGETVSKSYLRISSTTEGKAAVSVINGGHLILRDAMIWKIGDDASGSPTYGMAGAKGDASPDDGSSAPPPAPSEQDERENQDTGMPGGVLAGGLMPGGDAPVDTYPGPGAAHAGIYAGSGGVVSLENVSVGTAVGEGSGLYASGENASITLVNGTITTDGSTAHGVLVTHKGAVAVENVTIITKGEHSSALATFKGNGNVAAVGGTYTAFGKYSAGIYSAGNISVTGVVCKSEMDNAAVLEGGSRITLKDSVLWAREKGAVMIYQSFSGEAPDGPAKFEMTGGTISADDGPIFYVTNTTGSIFLKQVDLIGPSGILLKALKGIWDVDLVWAKPIQGGTVTLTAENQILPGDIVLDEFSTLIATLKDGTVLTGAVNAENLGKDVRLTLDASSRWQVTSDSYLTALSFSDGIPDAGVTNIVGNGHTVFYGAEASPALEGRVFDLPGGGTLRPLQR